MSDFSFEGTFVRSSPASFADKVGIPLGWIVVHHSHIPAKADRRIAHGEWFAITSDRSTIYRMLRFSPNIKKGDETNPERIVIDWIGWIDLHDRDENVDGPIRLKVRRVSWWKRPWAYLRHPDPAVRLSGWLGWASVTLGLIALLFTLPYQWVVEKFCSWGAAISSLYGGG
jgi:hypothetical protein